MWSILRVCKLSALIFLMPFTVLSAPIVHTFTWSYYDEDGGYVGDPWVYTARGTGTLSFTSSGSGGFGGYDSSFVHGVTGGTWQCWSQGASGSISVVEGQGYQFGLDFPPKAVSRFGEPWGSLTVTFTESFTVQEYSVVTAVEPAGSGVTSGDGMYAKNASVHVSCTPNVGKKVKMMSVSMPGGTYNVVGSTYDFTMPEGAVNVLWTLEDDNSGKFTVTVSSVPPEGGASNGGGLYDSGATASVRGTPAEGYKFDHIECDGTNTLINPYTFEVTKNVSVYVWFIVDESGGGGTGGDGDGDSDDDVPAINELKEAVVAKLSEVVTKLSSIDNGVGGLNNKMDQQLASMSDLVNAVNEIKEKLKGVEVNAGAINSPTFKAFEVDKNLENSANVDVSKNLGIKQLDDTRGMLDTVKGSLTDHEANVIKIDMDLTPLGVKGDYEHIYFDFADPNITVWRLRFRTIMEVLCAVSVCVSLFMGIVWTIRTC